MNNNTVRTKSVAKKIECFILLSFFCLLTPSLYAESSSAYAQAKKFTVTLNNVTLKEVISYVEKNSEFVFFYQPSELTPAKEYVNQAFRQQFLFVWQSLLL